MKVYPTLNVEMSYHNFGSAWLMILKGRTEEIDLAFNGLFNLGATNGSCEFKDHLQSVANFWSDEKSMEKFFFNQFFLPRCSVPNFEGVSEEEMLNEEEIPDEVYPSTTDAAYAPSVSFATKQMEELRKCHEFFLDFNNRFVPDTYSNGKISAERLDVDMKDAILTHAFADKPDSTPCKITN